MTLGCGRSRLGDSLDRVVRRLAILLLVGFSASAASAYRLAGPSAAAAPGSGPYAFDGVHWDGYRAALSDPSNFGPTGIKAPVPMASAAISTISEDSLSEFDGFLSPCWADADSTAQQVSAVVSFFRAGGDLVLLQDDTDHDEIGESLGLPIAGPGDGIIANGHRHSTRARSALP